MAELNAIVLNEDEEFMRQVMEDEKRYMRMGFSKEIQKERYFLMKVVFFLRSASPLVLNYIG